MADLKNDSPKKSVTSNPNAIEMGECESIWLISGPPFDQRDYMISPSESPCDSSSEKSLPSIKNKGGVHIDEKFILDSKGALKKLVELIRNECVGLFKTRIKNLILKYLQGCSYGFHIDDVPFIVEIVEYFSRNKSSVPEFTDFVKSFLCKTKDPPIVEKSSECLRSKEILIDYFTMLGELLATFDEECIQFSVLETIESLIFRRELTNIAAVKLTVCHEAMEESELPYVVALLMETVSRKLYIYYLDVAIQMIMVSLKAGYTMIQSNALHFVLWRLNTANIYSVASLPMTSDEENQMNLYYTVLEKSSYLIWGFLSVIPRNNSDIPCPGEEALRSLRYVFQQETEKKFQKALDTRNNLAGIIVKLCTTFGEKLPLFESGLVEDIAKLSVATEINPQDSWIKACEIGSKKEDYMLKKLMLLCCSVMTKNGKTIEALKSAKLIEGLLSLINPKRIAPWIPSQFINLYSSALQCLSELVPAMPEEYVLKKGNSKMLLTMKWCMHENVSGKVLLELLTTFCIIITCENNKAIIDNLIAKDGVTLLLDLCTYLLSIDSMKIEDQEKLSKVCTCLQYIFKSDSKILKQYGEKCAKVAVILLRRILNNKSCDSKWDPHLLLSFGGFMWESIAWCQLSFEAFLKLGGIFLLLDLIETSSFPIQILFLGILVEITHEGGNIPNLITWRGKGGFGLLDMLIDIWRKEELLNNVRRTPDGFIKDIEMPLMTEEQWYLTHQVQGSHIYSPSVAEMVCSVRPKIHALYNFLQIYYLDLTEKSESCYTLYLSRVRPSYAIYIPLLQHFLSLKMGEIWFEVLRDANISGVIPTAYDGQIMCSLIDDKNKWATRIKTMQEEIALLKQDSGIADEKKFLNFLKTCRLSSALDALRELDYVARTSFKNYQIQKKDKQILEVDNSLQALELSHDMFIHRTLLSQTKVTCTTGNYVKIKSEKESVEHEEVFVVSSDESDDNHFLLSDEYNLNQ